jgi:SAM-dependent methyltransferase
MRRYRDTGIVGGYRARTGLFPGEQEFLRDLDRRRARRLLDIGVGGGRTTPHFEPRCDEYVGVDFSPAMVETCVARFPGLRFEVGDVRDLSRFPDGHFDVVLFSFNGIDIVGGDADRQRAFAEMRRVCASGGRLFFSSKNLNQLPEEMQLSPHLRRAHAADAPGALPVRLTKEIARFARARALNPSTHRLLSRGGGLVADDREGLRLLRHYQVRPDVQVSRLRKLGFSDVEVYGMSGERVLPDQLASVRGDWIHYLCRST